MDPITAQTDRQNAYVGALGCVSSAGLIAHSNPLMAQANCNHKEGLPLIRTDIVLYMLTSLVNCPSVIVEWLDNA